MHNYHDVNRHIPPAVVLGPDGKTPHSWRVELLPFVDAAASLYLAVSHELSLGTARPTSRFSEHIPDVFREPLRRSEVAQQRILLPRGSGHGRRMPRIRDITDGTSNTILIVEARSEIFPGRSPKTFRSIPTEPASRHSEALCRASSRPRDVRRIRSFDDGFKDQLKWLIGIDGPKDRSQVAGLHVPANDGNPSTHDHDLGGTSLREYRQ